MKKNMTDVKLYKKERADLQAPGRLGNHREKESWEGRACVNEDLIC
jgi:hypothetical protein